MSADALKLAADFPPQDLQAWEEAAEASLKGKPLAKLTKRTGGGLEIPPLVGPEGALGPDAAGLPGQAPYTRGAAAAAAYPLGWGIAAEYTRPDPSALAAQVVGELERGVNEVHLCLDLAARRGLSPAEAEDALCAEGAPLHDLMTLQLALDGVHEDLAPVTLDAGASFAGGAALLVALWRARGRDLGQIQGGFGADPIGAAARGEGPPDLRALGELAAWSAAYTPRARAARVRSAPYHDAGATEVQELGTSLAVGVAYLRAMIEAGLEPRAAASQIELELTVGARFFLDVAKLRAARRLWARVQEAFGVDAPQVHLHAVESARMLTRRDPWVNMLRGTAACFAAAVAGVDSLRLSAFDARLGPEGALGRRIARNTQVILQEESHLGAVTDPAGGSWFVEKVTDDLGRAAWAELQAIEAAGGVPAVFEQGWLLERIGAAWARRAADIGKRKLPVTGVSEFPNLAEVLPAPDLPDLGAAREVARRRSAATVDLPKTLDFEAAVEAATNGARVVQLSRALSRAPGAGFEAWPVRHDAGAFEALRDASDAQAERPKVLLVNLGTVAQHNARATWAQSFFAAAGIEAVTNRGFGSPEAAVAALKSSGAKLAVLCGPDALYGEAVPKFAPALKAAGAERLFLAGRPGEARGTYEQAGVDDFVHIGCDVLSILQTTLEELGVKA